MATESKPQPKERPVRPGRDGLGVRLLSGFGVDLRRETAIFVRCYRAVASTELTSTREIVRTVVFDGRGPRVHVAKGGAGQLEREIALGLQSLGRPLDALLYQGPRDEMPGIMKFFAGAATSPSVRQDGETLFLRVRAKVPHA